MSGYIGPVMWKTFPCNAISKWYSYGVLWVKSSRRRSCWVLCHRRLSVHIFHTWQTMIKPYCSSSIKQICGDMANYLTQMNPISNLEELLQISHSKDFRQAKIWMVTSNFLAEIRQAHPGAYFVKLKGIYHLSLYTACLNSIRICLLVLMLSTSIRHFAMWWKYSFSNYIKVIFGF